MCLERLFLIEAEMLLSHCNRGELRDSTFGDVEVWWKDSTGKIVAEGYFGSTSSVSFAKVETDAKFEGYEATSFEAAKAERLRYLGQLCEYQSNNSDVVLIRDSEDQPWRQNANCLE